MSEFEWPEVVEQNINTSVFIDVGTIVTLYAPIGDEPSTYPQHPYGITEIIDKGPGHYRVKMRRVGP